LDLTKGTRGAFQTRAEDNAMPSNLNRRDPDRMKLPASSWWIPSLTAFGILLAVVAALA
jgi:hypothetical protein